MEGRICGVGSDRPCQAATGSASPARRVASASNSAISAKLRHSEFGPGAVGPEGRLRRLDQSTAVNSSTVSGVLSRKAV